MWNIFFSKINLGDYSYLRKSKMSPELSLSRKQNSSMAEKYVSVTVIDKIRTLNRVKQINAYDSVLHCILKLYLCLYDINLRHSEFIFEIETWTKQVQWGFNHHLSSPWTVFIKVSPIKHGALLSRPCSQWYVHRSVPNKTWSPSVQTMQSVVGT
jgi:hypothetical protein